MPMPIEQRKELLRDVMDEAYDKAVVLLGDTSPTTPPVPPPTTAPTIRFSLVPNSAATLQSDGSLSAQGPFNLEARCDGATSIEFKIDNDLPRTEGTTPFTLFAGDNTLAVLGVGQHTIVARAFSGTALIASRSITVTQGVAVPPPPSTSEPSPDYIPLSTNRLQNWDFSAGEQAWSTFTGSTDVENDTALGLDADTMKLTGSFPHFGQSISGLTPGSRVRIEGKVRSGNFVKTSFDNGVGLFADMRVVDTRLEFRDAIVMTMNGPALNVANTTAIIRCEWIIEPYAHPRRDVPSSQWSIKNVANGQLMQSGTSGGGANWGRTDNSDNGLYDPLTLPKYFSQLGNSNCNLADATAGKCNHPLPTQLKIIIGGHNWFGTYDASLWEYILCRIDPPGTY